MAESSTHFGSYKLSRELVGHTDEVRCLAVFHDGSIVSTSRDKTARFWRAKENYAECIEMKGHSDSVCSACVIEPTDKNPSGFILTGSYDRTICVYYPGGDQPIHTINGHEGTVFGLKASINEKEAFLSCSSDHTGKLWNMSDMENPVSIFSGHGPTIILWCIADLLNGLVISGGSDKSVIVYDRCGKVLRTLSGHLDCVRDIVAINENEFLTCSNDAVTRHWNSISGACLGTYQGHTNHIYSISALSSGTLAVSAGEDGTIRVWRNGKVDQILISPSQTVWNVKFLPNEDLVCGSSDGIVRIFTTDEKRHIDKKSMQRFEKAVLESMKEHARKNEQNTSSINL